MSVRVPQRVFDEAALFCVQPGLLTTSYHVANEVIRRVPEWDSLPFRAQQSIHRNIRQRCKRALDHLVEQKKARYGGRSFDGVMYTTPYTKSELAKMSRALAKWVNGE